MQYILFLALIPFGLAFGASPEGKQITVHEVRLGVEFHTEGGGPLSEVGMDQEIVNDKPIVLTLKKASEAEGGGPTVVGEYYSDEFTKTVKIQGVDFVVSIGAGVQASNGKEGAYSISGSVQRKTQKFPERITGVSTKNAESLREVVSISGWGKDLFWLNRKAKKVGRVELSIDVNEFKKPWLLELEEDVNN